MKNLKIPTITQKEYFDILYQLKNMQNLAMKQVEISKRLFDLLIELYGKS